jgi:predicted Fe-S protein YdhL (DUF1289 family)
MLARPPAVPQENSETPVPSDPLSFQFRPIPQRRVSSPCIGVCTLGSDGLCEGCLRTGAEIAAWGSLPEDERRRIMDGVLPVRAQGRGGC